MPKLIGIDNLKGDVLLGLGVGVGLIFLNILGLFSLAIPPVLNVFSTNVGKFIVIVLIAPIVEEIFFRGILYTFLLNTLKTPIMASLVQALGFALFHMVAYSGVLLETFNFSDVLVVGGAFLSAFLFGFLISLLSSRTNNLLTSIIPHAIINFWLIYSAGEVFAII